MATKSNKELELELKKLSKNIDKLFVQFGQKSLVSIQGFIGAEMNFKSAPSDATATWNDSDNLNIGSGNLFESFDPKSSLNKKISKSVFKDGKLNITVGSPLIYARTQEEGEVILATPTVDKNGSPTYKMAQYFFAKWYESGNEFFKAMAIYVKANGFITVPPRPYLAPAIIQYKNTALPKLLKQLNTTIFKRIT